MPFPHTLRTLTCIVLCALPLVAQSPNGNINGLVSDTTSRAIVAAEIIVVNDVTGVQYTTKTNGEGIYVLPNLPPGSYRIQVSKIGFKTLIKPDIVLNVQDALSINFTLPVGAVHEIVTVEGGAPLVRTEGASVGTVVDRNFVENLPLNGRSFNTLLQLTPGVVIAPSPSPGNPGQFSVAGQRSSANNFTVDGVSANFGVSANVQPGNSGTGQAQAFSALGSTSCLVSVDALQEFRVETSSFAPEFGRSPGGQVVLTTRSGTNNFHGGFFDYFRNTAMDANDWFANRAGQPRAQEHHNDFGGFLGGPIIRNKTFVFLSYEGARLDLPQSSSIQVPSLYARTQATPTVAPFLDAYPLPNGQPSSPAANTAPFTGSFSNRATLDAGSVRVDHNISDRFSIFARYSDAPSQFVKRAYIASELDTTSANVQTLTGGVNMFLSSRVSNTVRANVSRQNSDLVSVLDSFGGAVPPDLHDFFGPLSSSGSAGGTFLTFDTGSYQFGSPATNRVTQLNFVDDLSLTVGRHSLKFGADFRSLFLDVLLANEHFTFQGTRVANFLTGTVPTLIAGTSAPGHFATHALSLYAQDTFDVRPRLTLTYGLRWELSPAPSARNGTLTAPLQSFDNPANIALAGPGAALWRTTYGNVAPRFGAAYRLTATGDLVVRAGVGMFYDLATGAIGNLSLLYPGTATKSSSAVPLPITNASNYLPVVSLQPPYPFVSVFSPTLELPRSYQWNVALEKAIGSRQAVSVTYVGQAGRDLLREEALYRPNANFSSGVLLTQNDALSNYDALQVQYRRPLSSHIQALFNYTWAHSLDNASNDVVAGLSNTIISAANDYASSDFDVRQSFSGAVSYDLPAAARSGFLSQLTRNWSFQSVIVARSGFPFNAISPRTSPDPGGHASSRPDRVPGVPVFLYGAQCSAMLGLACGGGKTLNPAAFSIPSTTRQGSERRNDIDGFGLTQLDVSLSRKFTFKERVNTQLRVDAFNVLNHPNFANPQAYIGFGASYLQSQEMLNQGLGGSVG